MYFIQNTRIEQNNITITEKNTSSTQSPIKIKIHFLDILSEELEVGSRFEGSQMLHWALF